MRGLVIIRYKNLQQYSKTYDFFPKEEYLYDYVVYLDTSLNEPYRDLVNESNRASMLKALRNRRGYLDTFSDEEYVQRFLRHIEEKDMRLEELYREAEYVKFEFDVEDMVHYLKANPDLDGKKLIIPWNVADGVESLDNIEKLFQEDISRVYFQLEGNSQLVTLEDCKKTVQKIDEMAKRIKSLGLSPMEEVVYAYDLVRDREYIEEEEGEDPTLSRDLTSVLFGNKIVCVGYANILYHVLIKLGIKSKPYQLENVDGCSGHQRLVAYIDDDKYDIHGVYYFDPTKDRRKGNSRKFLYSYRNCAKTKEHMELSDEGRYIDVTFGDFDKEFVESFKKTVETSGIMSVDDEDIAIINEVSYFLESIKLIPRKILYREDLPDFLRKTFDKEAIFEALDRYLERFTKPLDAKTLLEIIFNVRKQEYYADPEKYPFGIAEFVNILALFTEEIPATEEELLLKALFGELPQKTLSRRYAGFLRDTGIAQEIISLKLTKTLSMVLAKRKSEEFDNKSIK